MRYIMRLINIAFHLKNFIFSLFYVRFKPGLKLNEYLSDLEVKIKSGLLRFLIDHPEIHHDVISTIIREISAIKQENDLVQYLEKKSIEIASGYRTLFSKNVQFHEYFHYIYLNPISEEQLHNITQDLTNRYSGYNPILVVGGCGFIGSHLVALLKNLHAGEIDIIDIESKSPLFLRKNFKDIKIFPIDITQKKSVNEFFEKQNNYKYIFNLAADKTLPSGKQDPYKTINTNFMGLLNLLTTIDELKKKNENNFSNLTNVVHTSTDKILSIRETFASNTWSNLTKQISIYDASKLAADIIALIYAELYEIPITIARLCNIFGPYDQNDFFRFIPKEIKRMVNEGKPPEYWDCSENDCREYLYIDDLIRILLQIACNPKSQHKIIDISGCYYDATKKVAEEILGIYNKSGYERIKGHPQKIPMDRIGMMQKKVRDSAFELYRIDSNVGYFYPFKEGIRQCIDYYVKEKTMQNYSEKFSNKLCLVTGGKGFIGSHLVEELIAHQNEVTVFDREPMNIKSYFTERGLQNKVEYVRGDICNYEDVTNVMRGKKYDIIFHLAAQPITPLSNKEPDDTLKINVMGTENILKSLSEINPTGSFIFASSACYYGITKSAPLKEDDKPILTNGYSTYTLSKVKAEESIKRYNYEHNLKTIICRFVNVYGPGDRHISRIVPKTIRAILDDKSVTLTRSNGKSVFSFLYVKDAVSAFILAAKNIDKYAGEVFNFGELGSNPRNILSLIETIYLCAGKQPQPPVISIEVQEPQVKKYLDPSKANAKLNWTAKTSLEHGLSETIKWIKEKERTIDFFSF